jgi:hypothetical protein
MIILILPFLEQSNPLNPSGHSHLTHFTPSSEQLPLFLHGCLSHGRTEKHNTVIRKYFAIEDLSHLTNLIHNYIFIYIISKHLKLFTHFILMLHGIWNYIILLIILELY